MILIIDNYDSFTYNLVQYLEELGARCEVVRNDVAAADELLERRPARIVISPGPGAPAAAGISIDLIRACGEIPLLGVCLGMQAIGEAFGGKVVRAPVPMHGKVSAVRHFGDPLFEGVASPFDATRYHSLVVARDSLPEELEVTAESDDGLIMALRHRDRPLCGVQFHPESIMTLPGKRILANFLSFS